MIHNNWIRFIKSEHTQHESFGICLHGQVTTAFEWERVIHRECAVKDQSREDVTWFGKILFGAIIIIEKISDAGTDAGNIWNHGSDVMADK